MSTPRKYNKDPITKNGGKYGYDALMKYVADNNIELVGEYTISNTNRDKKIQGKCLNCGELFAKSFRTIVEKAGAHCHSCSVHNGTIKLKNTFVSKFGEGKDNAQKIEEFKEKSRNTCKEIYGFEYAQSNPEIHAKSVATSIANNDGEHHFQTEKFKKECAETHERIRGVNHPSKDPAVIEKRKVNYAAKHNGIRHHFSNPETQQDIANTLFKKHGVYHPMHSQAIISKWKANSFRKKEHFSKSGRLYVCQGYEPFMIDYLIESGINEDDIITEDIPLIEWYDKEGKKHQHIVDILIKSENKCIEVKAQYIINLQKEENVRAKQAYGKMAGYNYEVWIFNGKGEVVETWV
jgi:hypothetical protein